MYAIDVDQASKVFSSSNSHSLTVLANLNLKVKRGEIVAITGPSGSGKSTLLGLLAGLDRPSQGTIRIENNDLASLDEKGLSRFRAKHLGIVFQNFHLMPHLTALENVLLPLEILNMDRRLERATAQLNAVGLSERLHHFPSTLSGGECQRVAIARALVVEPVLLLADEPSGNLDTETGTKVMSQLFDLTRKNNASLVLVTHNTDLTSQCDRHFILQQGTLHEKAIIR